MRRAFQKTVKGMVFMTYGDLPRVTFNNTLRLNDLTDQELYGVFQKVGSRSPFPYVGEYNQA